MATYLVTGAARGIGLELTKQLAELQGAQVFALTRSEPTAALRTLIDGSGGRVVSVLAAVDDTESVREAACKVEAHLGAEGGLDVLVNNAGIAGSMSPMEDCPPEELAQVLDTNLVGPQRVITAFLPLLRAGKEKKVINIFVRTYGGGAKPEARSWLTSEFVHSSSTMGAFSWAERLQHMNANAYKISKTGLNMLNKIFALDLASEGFTFLAISPGYIKTDMSPNGELPVEVGGAAVKKLILESTTADNGKFLNIHIPGKEDSLGKYDGKEISW